MAYGAAYTSHGLLDYSTQKFGGGVELLFPISDERFGLGRWGLSELPSRLPPVAVLRWLAVEFFIFAPPLLLLIFLRAYYSKRHPSGRETSRASE